MEVKLPSPPKRPEGSIVVRIIVKTVKITISLAGVALALQLLREPSGSGPRQDNSRILGPAIQGNGNIVRNNISQNFATPPDKLEFRPTGSFGVRSNKDGSFTYSTSASVVGTTASPADNLLVVAHAREIIGMEIAPRNGGMIVESALEKTINGEQGYAWKCVFNPSGTYDISVTTRTADSVDIRAKFNASIAEVRTGIIGPPPR